MNHLPVEAKRVVYLTVLVAVLIVLSVVVAYRYDGGPKQPLTITACSPTEFETNDQRCLDPGGVASPRPLQPFAAIGELEIEVAGRIVNDLDVSVTYSLIVSWVSINGSVVTQPGDSFTALQTPVTLPANTDRPYTAEWSIPLDLLELFEPLPPGTDLGRWRIVGTATPINNLIEDLVSVQWDSVRTFAMITPNEGL